jgi:arylsulfatase A-like enzyme
VDLYPTLLELAGAKPPAGYPLDGISYVACLRNGGKAKLAREALYWHFPGYLGGGANSWRTTPAGAIRSGEWKLLEFFEDGHLELYNLKDDIGEKQNLVDKMPEKTRELHQRLVAWRQSIGAPMPEHRAEIKPASSPQPGKGGEKRAKAPATP